MFERKKYHKKRKCAFDNYHPLQNSGLPFPWTLVPHCLWKANPSFHVTVARSPHHPCLSPRLNWAALGKRRRNQISPDQIRYPPLCSHYETGLALQWSIQKSVGCSQGSFQHLLYTARRWCLQDILSPTFAVAVKLGYPLSPLHLQNTLQRPPPPPPNNAYLSIEKCSLLITGLSILPTCFHLQLLKGNWAKRTTLFPVNVLNTL